MADRKVTFTLGTAVSPQSKKDAAALADAFKSVEAAAKAATKAMRDAHDAANRGASAAGGATRSRAGAGRGFAAGFDRAEAADRARALREESREREINLRQKIRAYEMEERAAAKAAATAKRYNSELNSGLKQAAAGIGNVARAFVYLGVSGEENIEKALRMLAKFEAGMAGIRGVSDIAGGVAKAGRAYRGLSAGAGLASGVGAVGLGTTVGLGVAAAAVGAGAGFGAARVAMGGHQFGQMTDDFGWTDYAGQHRARVAANMKGKAGQWTAQRAGSDFRSNQFNQQAATDLENAAVTGGLSGAANQAYANSDMANAQVREVNARIAAGKGGSAETYTRDQLNASNSQIQALSTIIDLDTRRLSIVNQAVAAEKERTQAIKDQQQSIRASIGLADAETVRLAEEAAKNIRLGKLNTPQHASALSAIGLSEYGQKEAAKIGEGVVARNPEIAALVEQLRKNAEAANKEMSVKVVQEVFGRIELTPNLEADAQKLKVALTEWAEQRRRAVKEALDKADADERSQQTIRIHSGGF